MAMFALVPESMWSMRWPMGCPMVRFAPETVPSRSPHLRHELGTGSFSKTNGASISAEFTPCACSSSSARPVRRVVTWISGTFSSSSSSRLPILLLSSNEMPGKLTAEMTSEPSLNSGKKLRPNCDSPKIATATSTTAAAMTAVLPASLPAAFWNNRFANAARAKIRRAAFAAISHWSTNCTARA